MTTPLRFYNAFQICLATLIASPVAGFVLMALNEKKFNSPGNAKTFFILAGCMIPAMVLLFGLTGASILTRLMPFVFCMTLLYLALTIQAPRIQEKCNADEAYIASSIDVVAIAFGILLALITLVGLFIWLVS